MLDSRAFRADVLPELLGRWDSREPMSPQVESDWYYVLREFTAKQAVEVFARFIRAHAKARFPRPGEFSEWKKTSGTSESKFEPKSDAYRYAVDLPEKKSGWHVVKVFYQPRNSWHVGFIVRYPGQNDQLHIFVWEYFGSKRDAGCFRAYYLNRPGDAGKVELLPGDVPKSWGAGALENDSELRGFLRVAGIGEEKAAAF